MIQSVRSTPVVGSLHSASRSCPHSLHPPPPPSLPVPVTSSLPSLSHPYAPISLHPPPPHILSLPSHSLPPFPYPPLTSLHLHSHPLPSPLLPSPSHPLSSPPLHIPSTPLPSPSPPLPFTSPLLPLSLQVSLVPVRPPYRLPWRSTSVVGEFPPMYWTVTMSELD